MQAAKCPGQDRRNWKPEDIFDHNCPHCQTAMEFWKTDARMKCPGCGEHIMNPRFNLGCALWCAYAEQCVGDISQIFAERPEALRDRLELEVRRYFIGESERLKFTLEGGTIASRLLEVEKDVEPPVIIGAVLLHDAGYAHCKDEHQEEKELQSCIREKSVELAVKIMKELKMPRPVQDKVKELILNNGEAESTDTNGSLFLDIKELTTGKLTALQGDLSADAKKKIIKKLRRKSSREFAESILSGKS